MWAGELLDPSLRPDLDRALEHGSVSTGLFETHLAAVENLCGSFPEDFRQQMARRSSTLKRVLPEGLIVQFARDANLPPDVRALAIGRFGARDIQSQRQWLLDCLSADDEIFLAIVTRVAHVDSGQFADFGDALTALTLDDSRSTAIRSEAIFALRRFRVSEPERFLPLLRSVTADLAIETARSYGAWVMAGHATLGSDDIAQMNLSPEVAWHFRVPQNSALLDDATVTVRW